MADKDGIGQIIEKVVTQVLEAHVPQLHADLVRQVMQELPAHLGEIPAAPAGEGSPVELLKAVSAIHAGSTQKEILRALLDGAALYCGRTALFVVKAGTAHGWQGRGFSRNDEIKDYPFQAHSGLAAHAMQARTPASGSQTDVDASFLAHFSAPAGDPVIVLPLMLKDKVAALVYADIGLDGAGKFDPVSLELLVSATSAWLEVASLRKQAAKEAAAEPAAEKHEAVPVQTVSSYSDPFAGHQPHHAAAAAPQPAPVEEPEPVAVGVAHAAQSEAVAAASTPSVPEMSPEDADVHRKAQRFARLLVDEIKLYNQAKVAEGRKNRDIYDRLKEDIEKSRATYTKRYGSTVAAVADYFASELVRSLAEDDSSLMGANFRR
jgi:hypothetical protein